MKRKRRSELGDFVVAAVDQIGRSGATEFECGWLEDDGTRSWATARYRGTRIMVDEQPDIVTAIGELLGKVLFGAECQFCHRTIPFGCQRVQVGRRFVAQCTMDKEKVSNP